MSRWHPFTDLRILHMAPRAAGVYRIRSVGGQGKSYYVYIGQAVNLESRLLEHRRGVSEEADCIRQHTDLEFAWENIDGETERRAREIELLHTHRPCCNKE